MLFPLHELKLSAYAHLVSIKKKFTEGGEAQPIKVDLGALFSAPASTPYSNNRATLLFAANKERNSNTFGNRQISWLIEGLEPKVGELNVFCLGLAAITTFCSLRISARCITLRLAMSNSSAVGLLVVRLLRCANTLESPCGDFPRMFILAL